MAQVIITFNKRTYRFECAEGDAERIEKLANYLKTKLDALMREHGQLGDERLILMAALMLTDELFEARADIDNLLEGETEKLKETASNTQALREAVNAEAARKTGTD